MDKILASCSKGAVIALALVLLSLEAIAQKSKDDKIAEAIGKALEKSINETAAMIKATSVDLHCAGKGIHRFDINRERPQSYQVTEKLIRFFKTPSPARESLPEPMHWTVVIDGQAYIHWFFKETTGPSFGARSSDINTVWISEREISVESKHHSGERDFRRTLDLKISRLTGNITFSAMEYSGDQLAGEEFFNGTCHRVTQKF